MDRKKILPLLITLLSINLLCPATPLLNFHFIKNVGQLSSPSNHEPIKYYYQSPYFQVFFFEKKISYVFYEKGKFNSPQIKTYRIDLLFKNPSPYIQLNVAEKRECYYNFYTPQNPTGLEKVPAFGKLVYTNVWKDIDIEFLFSKEASKGALKYNIVARKGANLQNIQFEYQGQDTLIIEPTGRLQGLINHQIIFEEAIPLAFYQSQGKKQNVNIYYKKIFSRQIGFYSPCNIPNDVNLVIDPIIWSTYLGGNNFDRGNAIQVDAQENIIIAGDTRSANFPTKLGQSFVGRPADAYFAKFSTEGEMLWCTLYGGSNEEQGHALAINANNEIYVTGRTSSSDFPLPITPLPFQTTYRGGTADAYLIKLNTAGIRIWATYYGGRGFDNVTNIAISPSDQVTIIGDTDSPDLSFPPGAYQGDLAGTGWDNDIFVVQFNAAGNLQWGTYWGGTNFDFAYGVAIDQEGNTIICGQTLSDNFPILGRGNNVQPNKAGNSDAFIIKLNRQGLPIWSTFYGGSGAENAKCVAINTQNQIFITGNTTSSDFPLLSDVPAYQSTLRGGTDVFLLLLSPDLVPLYNTLLGGVAEDRATGIRLIADEKVLISGETRSNDFPFPISPKPDYSRNQGGQDLFLIQFACKQENTLVPYWGSYFGGSQGEEAAYHNLAFSATNHVAYLIGTTQSQNFPLLSSSRSYIQSYGGGAFDAFIFGVQLPCTSPSTYPPIEKNFCPGQHFRLELPELPTGVIVYLYDSPTSTFPIDSSSSYPYIFDLPTLNSTTTYYYRVVSLNSKCLSCFSSLVLRPYLPAELVFRVQPRCKPGRFSVEFTINSPQQEVIRIYTQENSNTPIATLTFPNWVYLTDSLFENSQIFAEIFNPLLRCSGPKVKIPLTFNLLKPPIALPASRCGAGKITLSIQYEVEPGVELRLYNNLLSITPTIIDSIPPYHFNLEVTSTTSFYVQAFNKLQDCVSARVSVKIIINP
ncbi:MAG: hypothetical protein RML72_09930, partial [Bacteroidia bacterium]|nr:hypothetical protein [Bacteroidia bacterium]